MNTSNIKFKDVDEYIMCFPAEAQLVLKKIRLTIKKAAPKAIKMHNAIKVPAPAPSAKGQLDLCFSFNIPLSENWIIQPSQKGICNILTEDKNRPLQKGVAIGCLI